MNTLRTYKCIVDVNVPNINARYKGIHKVFEIFNFPLLRTQVRYKACCTELYRSLGSQLVLVI